MSFVLRLESERSARSDSHRVPFQNRGSNRVARRAAVRLLTKRVNELSIAGFRLKDDGPDVSRATYCRSRDSYLPLGNRSRFIGRFPYKFLELGDDVSAESFNLRLLSHPTPSTSAITLLPYRFQRDVDPRTGRQFSNIFGALL